MGEQHHWQWTSAGFTPVTALPLTDRGFRYGMAVFETLRVSAGTARLVAAHLESLTRACRDSAFPLPAGLGPVGEFLTGYDWPAACGVVRVHVTAGDGGPGDPVEASRIFLTFEVRAALGADALARGYRLQLSANAYSPAFGGRKTNNYWANARAYRTARQAGYDEALLFAGDGELLSATMGNVLVAFPGRHGRLCTPPATSGVHCGVVRGWLMERLDVEEMVIDRRLLAQAAAVFVTNSWIGVMPASHLEQRRLDSFALQQLPGWSQHCHDPAVCWDNRR